MSTIGQQVIIYIGMVFVQIVNSWTAHQLVTETQEQFKFERYIYKEAKQKDVNDFFDIKHVISRFYNVYNIIKRPYEAKDIGKLKFQINVKDYGAIGDGEKDDTEAIKLAVSKIRAFSGGVLYFPKGRYLMSESIDLPSQIIIEGDGKESIIFTKVGSWQYGVNILSAKEKSNIVIRDICVEGSNFGNAFPEVGKFDGMGAPILMIGCKNILVYNCFINKGGGIHLYPDGSYYRQGVANIYFSSCENVIVNNNYITYAANGICFDDWYGKNIEKKNFYTKNIMIYSNYVSQCNNVGIVIDLDAKGKTNLNLFNNVVTKSEVGGYDIKGVIEGVAYSNYCNGDKGGRVNSTQFYYNTIYGVLFDFKSNKIKFYNNALLNNYSNNIKIINSSNLVIEDNKLSLVSNADKYANNIYANWESDMKVGTIRIANNKLNSIDDITLTDQKGISFDLSKVTTNRLAIDISNNEFINRSLGVGIYNGTNNTKVKINFNTFKVNSDKYKFIFINGTNFREQINNKIITD